MSGRPPLNYLAQPLPNGRWQLSIVSGFATFDTLDEAKAYIADRARSEAEKLGLDERPVNLTVIRAPG